jgi:hypothetical protein
MRAAKAADDDKQKCVAAYEDGQRLRKDGKLSAAREKFLFCAQDVCTAARKDCTIWLGEVEQLTPSIIPVATADGKDVVQVRILVDGIPLVDRLDGKAIRLDPGAHAFRFEAKGYLPHDEQILIREGEKNRRVAVRLVSENAPVTPPVRPPVSIVIGPDVTKRNPTPAMTYVFGAIGIVGLGVFTGFALNGSAKQTELDDQGCKPRCPQSRVNSVKNNYLIADIALGASVASLSVAAILFFARGSTTYRAGQERSALRFDVSPLEGGARAGLAGSF